MSNPARIAPPADAPLPWSLNEVRPWHIHDADGRRVAVCDNPRFAAYVVAAANALPGLVEVARALIDWDGDGGPEIEDRQEGLKLGRIVSLASAALAALPKEPER